MLRSLWGSICGREMTGDYRVFVTLLLAILMAAPAAADDAGSFDFGLSVHVVGGGLSDLGDLGAYNLNLAGLPVEIGAMDGAAPGNPGLHLGFDGGHALPLGAGFSLVTTGSFAKTRYLDDVGLGRDRVKGKTSLRFDHGSFRSALEPGIDVDLFAGVVDTRRLLLDGRIARDLFDNVALTASGGWAQHAKPLTESETEFGRGRLGLDIRLGSRTTLDLSYEMRQAWTELPQDATQSAGPAAALSVALLGGLSFDIGYQYCESTRHAFDDGLRALVDDRHAASMSAKWADPDMEYLVVTAGYRYDRIHEASALAAVESHDGMINLAVSF